MEREGGMVMPKKSERELVREEAFELFKKEMSQQIERARKIVMEEEREFLYHQATLAAIGALNRANAFDAATVGPYIGEWVKDGGYKSLRINGVLVYPAEVP
jgi:hypothetical protein